MIALLKEEYQRILDNNILQMSIQAVREQFHPLHFSDIKIIDSILWGFVSKAKGGALLYRDIQYL